MSLLPRDKYVRVRICVSQTCSTGQQQPRRPQNEGWRRSQSRSSLQASVTPDSDVCGGRASRRGKRINRPRWRLPEASALVRYFVTSGALRSPSAETSTWGQYIGGVGAVTTGVPSSLEASLKDSGGSSGPGPGPSPGPGGGG